jgi:predicted DsbA family dithiol-disulfide isomerase
MELEIWSDIACPWCYIGKRRLETALGRFEHADAVTITWPGA